MKYVELLRDVERVAREVVAKYRDSPCLSIKKLRYTLRKIDEMKRERNDSVHQ